MQLAQMDEQRRLLENNLKRWPFLDLKYYDNDDSGDKDGETRKQRTEIDALYPTTQH